MSEKIQKVLSNCVQGLTDAEQLQARTNIGAIGGVKVKQAGGSTEELVPDSDGKVTVDLSDVVQVQSDWTEDNPLDPSYINNKPDLATVATSGSYDDLRNKPTIPQPVQSNWTEGDSADPSYIQNKPNLATVATSGSYEDLTDKPDIPGSQVQSDWTETDTASKAYILHKPTIPQPVQSNWTETDTADPSYIRNKPNLATVATSGSYNDLSNKPVIPAAQVQSDWAQSDSSAVDFIKNKPTTMDTKALVPGTNIEFASAADSVTINSTATKVTKTSNPYTSPVDLSSVTIFDPGEDFGSLVRDQGGHTLGYLAPKHYGNLDVGKVLTIVSDNGYKMEWQTPPEKEFTAGYRISIGPGANNTTVIANTMHESVIDTCLSWDTLANNYDFDYYWGNWRCHVHLAAFSDWAQDDGAIHIRLSHVYASEAAQKIKCGSYQVQNFYPYKSGNSYDFTNSHWYFDGRDPYTTATIPDQYGFKFHLMSTTPTEQEPDDQKAHRFIVDTGAPYGDWLELDASVRFMVPNAAPSSNGIYLLLKGKYAYSYQ